MSGPPAPSSPPADDDGLASLHPDGPLLTPSNRHIVRVRPLMSVSAGASCLFLIFEGVPICIEVGWMQCAWNVCRECWHVRACAQDAQTQLHICQHYVLCAAHDEVGPAQACLLKNLHESSATLQMQAPEEEGTCSAIGNKAAHKLYILCCSYVRARMQAFSGEGVVLKPFHEGSAWEACIQCRCTTAMMAATIG